MGNSKLWIMPLGEGEVLPENAFLCSGKITDKFNDEVQEVWTPKIVANPLILLPSTKPEESIWMYFYTDVDTSIGINKENRSKLKLDEDFKAEQGHYYLVNLPLTDNGNTKYPKYGSLTARFLLKVIGLDRPVMASFDYGGNSIQLERYLSGEFTTGKRKGTRLTEDDFAQIEEDAIEWAESSEPIPGLDVVKAFIAKQKSWSGFSKAETRSEQIAANVAWLKDASNVTIAAEIASMWEIEDTSVVLKLILS